MIRIVIVEDEAKERELLRSYLDRYFAENLPNVSYRAQEYDKADSFLFHYQSDADIVFMDIQMPGTDGMQAAEKLREIDRDVPLVFITNLSQYAVHGYDVNAVGFIVKPMSYYDFLLRIRRIIGRITEKQERMLTLSGRQGTYRIPADEINWIEVQGHTIFYHTGGDTLKSSGRIADIERELPEFIRSHNSYLVNPRAIRSVSGYTITLKAGETVPISHPRRKEFIEALNRYLGGTERWLN